MSKAKKVVFTEEESTEVLSGLEEHKESSVEQIKDEEIESLFTFQPMHVEEIPRQDSTIEVTPVRDFKCSFAGEWYYFVKGKPQRVPVALRDFLLLNKNNPKIKDIW